MGQGAAFKQLRFDENYAYLAADTTDNWYHNLKFSPVSADKRTYFSFGGDVRYQYFHYTNQDWGEAPQDKDGFVLTRYLGHVDFHAGRHFRTFVQLQSSLADGEAKTPSPVDQNTLDLHQAFTDYRFFLNNSTLTARAGRQELSYGSQRLVSLRDAPNNRQAFDALKLMYDRKNAKLDLFYSYYVPAKSRIFDDRLNTGTRFWGAYSTFTKLPVIANADLYYLGIHKASTVFDEGKGKEDRHSVGTRIWGATTGWQYDAEGVYQFGKFNSNDISAWTVSANVSYTLRNVHLTPQFGLKTEAISGDNSYNDGKLNTFDPLFPRGGYFGLAALIGPSNLFDTHPYIQFNLSKKLIAGTDYDMFWRMNRNDGLYAVNGKMLYSGRAGTSKQIGRQLCGSLEYTPNKYFYFREEVTWFEAGEFLKQAGPGKDILMLGSTIAFKF